MGLFGRRRVTPSELVVTSPVPGTPAERVEAVKAELLRRGLGGAAAQGRPLVPGDGLDEVVAVVRHLLPDPGERRALCGRLAQDLHSMIAVEAVDAEEILDVLGATPARWREHAVPHRSGAAARDAADGVLGLARDLHLGEGDQLDRWAADDDRVLEALAVLLVVFTRLAV